MSKLFEWSAQTVPIISYKVPKYALFPLKLGIKLHAGKCEEILTYPNINEEANIDIEDLEQICPFYKQQFKSKDKVVKHIVMKEAGQNLWKYLQVYLFF